MTFLKPNVWASQFSKLNNDVSIEPLLDIVPLNILDGMREGGGEREKEGERERGGRREGERKRGSEERERAVITQ